MGSGEIIHDKVFASPRPPPKISFKHDWMKEQSSEVAGGGKDSQQTQPKTQNPIVRTRRLVWQSNHPLLWTEHPHTSHFLVFHHTHFNVARDIGSRCLSASRRPCFMRSGCFDSLRPSILHSSPCLSSSFSFSWSSSSSSMWVGSGRSTLCASASEKLGTLADNNPLTSYEPNVIDNYHISETRIEAISRLNIRYNSKKKIDQRSRHYPWTHRQDSGITEWN